MADLRSEFAGQPDEQLLRSLGLVDREGRLLVAGEVLLARPAAASIAYLARESAGGEPSAVHLREPLILALPEVLGRIRERARPELSRIVTPTGQEIAIPDFPPVAVDEAVTNALVHRDWSQSAAVVVDHNPLSLRVWSPGGLPAGVDPEHLLTTTSRPRNTTLMNAHSTLGLAEATSRGFDRMYREMIRTGRDAPVVVPDDFSVEIIFTSGAPNRAFATYVAGLPERLRDDVNVLLTLMKLCEGPRIGADQAAILLQVQPQEAERVLEWMATTEVGLLIPDRGKASSARWRLAPATHADLGTAVAHRAKGDFALTQVTAHLEEYGWITNRTVRNMFSLDVQQARALLAGLRDQGLIIKDPDGPDRGPGIRWLPGPAGPRSRNRTRLRREPDR